MDLKTGQMIKVFSDGTGCIRMMTNLPHGKIINRSGNQIFIYLGIDWHESDFISCFSLSENSICYLSVEWVNGRTHKTAEIIC